MTTVWVFMGAGATNPSGVFTTREKARAWISEHQLSGLLTEYPLDTGVLAWAIAQGYYKPKSELDTSPGRHETFTSGAQRHEHYENGENG